MLPFRLLLACVVAPALALPASAGAASVEAHDGGCAVAPCVVELTFTARPGERNDVTVAYDGDGVVVTDAGAEIVPGSNCARIADGSVRCALARPITQFILDTGDGDDVLRAPLAAAGHVSAVLGAGADRFSGEAKVLWADGWDGDDEITGTASDDPTLRGMGGDDVLQGGVGDDVLQGGAGRDVLRGAGGDDVLHGIDRESIAFLDPDDPVADVLDGGEGRDRVTYEEHVGPYAPAVTVDLARGIGDDGDRLVDVEDAVGGDGEDELVGDDGPNRLQGGRSGDVLEGAGGDDRLRTGNAQNFAGKLVRPDRARGGAGDDVVGSRGGLAYLSGGDGDDEVRAGRKAVASCGAGEDIVMGTSFVPQIDRACEQWSMRLGRPFSTAAIVRFAHPERVRDAVRLDVPCPQDQGDCILILRVTTPAGRLLGQDRDAVRAGTTQRLVARMPPGYRRGSFRGRVAVTVRRGPRPVLWSRGGVVATLS